MSVESFIIERFAEIATIAFHIYFLYRTLDTKVNRKKQVLAGTIFILLRIGYYILGFGYRPYFSVIAGVLYARFVFAGNFKAYILWTIIPVVLDGIVDSSIISLYLLFPNTLVEQVDLPGITRIFIIVAAKATMFMVYYFITRKIDKSHTIQWFDCLSLLSVPIGCWVILEIIFNYGNSLSKLLVSAGSIVLLLMMASVIALYNRNTAKSKELTQSKLQLRTAEMTQDHINQVSDMYARLSSIRHDLHNHFVAISGYLKAREYDALEQYISNLTNVDMDTAEYVKHPVLNALISSRMEMAKEAKIDFTVTISLPEKLPITDVDLCILVSNILDNAFEANARAAEPRFINLCTRVVKSYWVVACRNATCDQTRFRAAGALKSTKEDEGIHGIGTKQIQAIAEKTGGFVTYRHENYEFSTLAMIKL